MFGILYFFIAGTISLGVGVYAAFALGLIDASVVFLALATAALAWVGWLLFRSAQSLTREPDDAETVLATGRRRKELEREKQLLLKALKELEFDHEMGKVSDADYREIGGQYRARATRVLRQLDETGREVNYRELVERDVQARVKSKKTVRESPKSREPAPSVKAEKAAKTEEPAKEAPSVKADTKSRCASCDTQNDADAEFCKRCGARLAAGGSEAAKS